MLALLTLLALGQEGPPPVPPAEPAAVAQSAPSSALATDAPSPTVVKTDPGWAREGAVAGFVLSAAPLGFAIGATVALWTHNGTAQDWLTVGAGLSALLAGVIPTLGGRSAVVADDELTRKPRVLRIVGWVMTVYGALALITGVLGGQVFKFIAGNARITTFESGAWPTILGVAGTVTTLFDGALCSAGLVMLSMASNLSADRASQSTDVTPTVMLAPVPGGGFAVGAGLSGRL